jgi:methylenetetrahydrofolate dehydrogenase (NADP+)/methenyltetrahydrofolate cyclohydrolase
MLYVRNKQLACSRVGIQSVVHTFPATVSTTDLLATLHKLNGDKTVHGILVQMPLPTQVDRHAILSAINPAKDVDGLHPANLGLLMAEQKGFVPCTPQGIMHLIHHAQPHIAGLHAVVVGRSVLVGKPIAQLLLRANATVTHIHSHTPHSELLLKQGDIIVAAAGVPRLIQAHSVKPGAIVIDVGINRMPDGTLQGDVDFAAVKPLAQAITPVPGGVGPMTVAYLLQNTLRAFKNAE